MVKHHAKLHSALPFSQNLFTVSHTVNRDRCDICDKYLKEGGLTMHNHRQHSQIRGDRVNRNICSEYLAHAEMFDRAQSQKIAHQQEMAHRNANKTESREGTLKIYKCTICPANGIMENNLRKHLGSQKHKIAARVNVMTNDKDVFQLVVSKVECKFCSRPIHEKNIAKHLRFEHKIEKTNTTKDLYKCGICDAYGISERTLKEHHSHRHDNGSFNKKDFKLVAIKQDVKCDICYKRKCEGRSKKHPLKTCLRAKSKIENSLRSLRQAKKTKGGRGGTWVKLEIEDFDGESLFN